MDRQYLASLLRKHGKIIGRYGGKRYIADVTIKATSKRRRKNVYGGDIERALRMIWLLYI